MSSLIDSSTMQPRFRALYEHWKHLPKPGGLVRRRSIDPCALPRGAMPFIVLLEASRVLLEASRPGPAGDLTFTPRRPERLGYPFMQQRMRPGQAPEPAKTDCPLRIRLASSGVVRAFGRELKGAGLGDMDFGNRREQFIATAMKALTEKACLHLHGCFHRSVHARLHNVEAVFLPLSESGGQADGLLCGLDVRRSDQRPSHDGGEPPLRVRALPAADGKIMESAGENQREGSDSDYPSNVYNSPIGCSL